MNLDLCTKILDAEQIRQADQFTIKNEPIASIDLMERASEAFVEHFIKNHSCKVPVLICCGTGNNGGDGLVIARLLSKLKYKVSILIIGDPKMGSKDFKINLQIVKARFEPIYIKSNQDFPVLVKKMVVVDAIFGSGLTRGVSGLYGELIDYINASTCEDVVAVDIASGLGCNQNYQDGKVLNVSETITFQVAKLSHHLPQNSAFSGKVKIVNIGLDDDFINAQSTRLLQVTPEFVHSLYAPRDQFLHKGRAGHSLIIAGSKGKMGAAVLAARAGFRAGAGLLTTHLPKCGNDIMQICTPEAMVSCGSGLDCIADIPDLDVYDAVGVGPGLGQEPKTQKALEKLLKNYAKPIVIDADALNILAENPSWLKKLPKHAILTPHPGEFKRLVGTWDDDYQRLEMQKEFAQQQHAVVILKGAYTSIATPDGLVFFNTTGNPGMATGGSGDVLTGILTALIGQGYSTIEAAILGVYVHGLAGDIYVKNRSQESLTASDLISHLGEAMFTISDP